MSIPQLRDMEIKAYKHIIFLGLGFLVTAAAYLWFYRSPYFSDFDIWVQGNILMFSAYLFLIKAIGIIWPPIPGGLLTLGAVPFLGWWQAYFVDLLGSITGASAAFFIARRWGLGFISRIFDERIMAHIKNIKIPVEREIEAIFIFRLFGGTIVEIISYASGFFRVRFRNFLLATIASHLVVGVPFFYFTNGAIQGRNVAFSVGMLFILLLIFLLLKKRYFVKNENLQ